MKKYLAIILILVLYVIPPPRLFAQTYDLVGTWEGALAVSGTELRIVFHVESVEEGALSATMDSPDQGAYGIGCGEVTHEGTKVLIPVPGIGGRFEGNFTDEKSIEGTWSQGPANLPLNLSYTEEVEELKRPQEPQPPYPYEVRDVTFENNAAGITMAGTLTVPEGQGPFPATILVSGSGPQDRNEAVFGHKPFLVLADHLTRNGIAVLRYDDRGVGGSSGDFASATSKDFASDAEAALKFLKKQEGINANMVGITGHSEGGLIAPMVASELSEVNFIVMLAGPGITGEEILILQTRLISEAAGSSEEDLNRSEAFLKKVFTILREDSNPNIQNEKFESYVDEIMASLTEEEKEDPNISRAAFVQRFNSFRSPWMQFFLTFDPVPSIEKVKCPVLALNGEKDLQVPSKENLEAIENALQNGQSKDYRVEELPGLNHLFQHSETGAPSEYAKLEETFSEEAMKLIFDWIVGLK